MGKTGRKRLKEGDVLEVETPEGLAYVQFVGQHPEYGDLIRVIPGIHETRPSDLPHIIAQVGYMTFYPAQASINQEFNVFVGSFDLPPEGQMPKVLRREIPNFLYDMNQTLGWAIIESNGCETKVRSKDMTDAQKKLPIIAIWNHEILTDRICNGWTPEQEV